MFHLQRPTQYTFDLAISIKYGVGQKYSTVAFIFLQLGINKFKSQLIFTIIFFNC